MRFIKNLALLLALANPAQAIQWQSVFVAGDNSIENFDNGRKDLSQMFGQIGQLNQVHLSSAQNEISETKGVWAATQPNLSSAFPDQTVGAGEGCLVHMTSHGAKSQGFYLALSGILSPASFAQFVNRRCGKAPTIVLISACFSGQFVTPALQGDNRVILTAASSERPSFGCSPDTRYTYWDNCLLQEVPRSRNWTDVATNVRNCIQARESAEGFESSNPQSFIGTAAKAWINLL